MADTGTRSAWETAAGDTLAAVARMDRRLTGVVIVLVAVTAGAMATLWPGPVRRAKPVGPVPPTYPAVVRAVLEVDCTGFSGVSGLAQEGLPDRAARCDAVTLQLTAGPRRGMRTYLSIARAPGEPVLRAGNRIVVSPEDPADLAGAYYFVTFERGPELVVLALAFALLVVAVGRLRGLGALAGLAVTALVLVSFVLPALLDGEAPLPVALVGAAAIVLVVLYVAHGVSDRTSTALVGTLASLALTGLLAWAATRAAALFGLGDTETNTLLQSFAGQVQLQGIILAGIVIGSLGVLNDVTVTQASAVWEIWGAHPGQGLARLYRAGMRVGRDHIASTVYTLVLAYAGAALPLLLLFMVTGQRFTTVVTSDLVSEEVVRTLAGSIGLVAAVPLTTLLAALVVRTRQAGPLPPLPA